LAAEIPNWKLFLKKKPYVTTVKHIALRRLLVTAVVQP